MASRSRAGRREHPGVPVHRAPEKDLCPGGPASDGCPVGSLRRRAPVQGPAGIEARPFDSQGEVQLEAGMVRGCRLGVKETSGVCARRRREGARGTGVRARRRRAVADGGLAAVVRGGRGGRNRRGDRDAARTGGREPDGAGLRRPLDQPEAARPFPGPLLAGGREGRPAGRAGTRLGAAYRPALSATAGTDRPGDH